MKLRNKTVFHIGFPKSASTTLQKKLFDKHAQINFMGIYPTGNIGQDAGKNNIDTLYLKNGSLKKFHCCLTDLEGIEYYFSKVESYYSEVELLMSTDKINIFSNERFTSVLFTHKDRAEKARRIKCFFPDAKIIIVLRNQLDIIKSQYRDHPFDPRNLYANRKSVSIDEWINRDFLNYDISFVKSIEYYKVVKFYSDFFGRENVGVFIFEEMVWDLPSFSKKISSFLDVDERETYALLDSQHENEGVTKSSNIYRKMKSLLSGFIPNLLKKNRTIKRLEADLLQYLKKGKKQNILVGKEAKQKVESYYSEQNRKLANEFGLDLKKYGYVND